MGHTGLETKIWKPFVNSDHEQLLKQCTTQCTISHYEESFATEDPLLRSRILYHNRTTLSCVLCFVVCAPRACHCAPSALSHALCLIMESLLLAQCLFSVTTPMNSVTRWYLLIMTELCCDLKFSCRDLVSIAHTPLCHDKEMSCRYIKFLAAFIL